MSTAYNSISGNKAFKIMAAMGLITQYDLTLKFINFLGLPKNQSKTLEECIKEFEKNNGPVEIHYSLVSPFGSRNGDVFVYQTPKQDCKPESKDSVSVVSALNTLFNYIYAENASGTEIFLSKSWTVVSDFISKYPDMEAFQKNLYTVLGHTEKLWNSAPNVKKDAASILELGVQYYVKQYLQKLVYDEELTSSFSFVDSSTMNQPVMDFKIRVPKLPVNVEGKDSSKFVYYADRSVYYRAVKRYAFLDEVCKYLKQFKEICARNNVLFKTEDQYKAAVKEYNKWKNSIGGRPTKKEMQTDAKNNLTPLFQTSPYESWSESKVKYLTRGLAEEVETNVFPNNYNLFNLQNGWSNFSDGSWETLTDIVAPYAKLNSVNTSFPSI